MFGDMEVRYMPNSDPWGPPGTRVMTIFVFYVNPQIPNIQYFEANEIYKSREVSHFFSHQISLRMPSNAVRIMSGREEVRKGGKEEGRKRGREEGRKEGREEGRKGGRRIPWRPIMLNNSVIMGPY